MYFGVIAIAFVAPYLIVGLTLQVVFKKWGLKGLFIAIAAAVVLTVASLAYFVLTHVPNSSTGVESETEASQHAPRSTAAPRKDSWQK